MIKSLHPSWPFWLAALIALIAIPWFMLRNPDQDIALRPLPTATSINLQQPRPAETALSAPLFVQGRRLPDDNDIQTAEFQEPPTPITEPTRPELVGLISAGGGKSAAILKGGDNVQKTLRAGEAIDGWRITQIGRNFTLLVQNGQSVRLELNFQTTGRGGGTTSLQSKAAIEPQSEQPVTSAPTKMEDNQ